jgi:hypothetical protein
MAVEVVDMAMELVADQAYRLLAHQLALHLAILDTPYLISPSLQ